MIGVNELTSSMLCYAVIIKSYSRRKEREGRRTLGKEIRGEEGRKDSSKYQLCPRY